MWVVAIYYSRLTIYHSPFRGLLKPGMFADVVIFDPLTIGDRATFENRPQYSVGLRDVFVN
jgi:N-acyl-D-aspartate/D-glutamate deacylase